MRPFVETTCLSAYGDRHEQLGLAIAAFVTTGFFVARVALEDQDENTTQRLGLADHT